MNKKKKKFKSGFSIIEVMLTLGFLLALVLGTMGFSYYSTLDTKKSDVKSTAARICSMILEDWKATGGKSTYDAVAAFEDEFDISQSTDSTIINLVNSVTVYGGNDTYIVNNIIGSYKILINYTNHYVTLWYNNSTATEPRMLNVRSTWMQDFSTPVTSKDTLGYTLAGTLRSMDSVTISMYADN